MKRKDLSYCQFSALCFLLAAFCFNQVLGLVTPQLILETKIFSVCVGGAFLMGTLWLALLYGDKLTKKFPFLLSVRLSHAISRMLRLTVLAFPLCALGICSFLFVGECLFSEHHDRFLQSTYVQPQCLYCEQEKVPSQLKDFTRSHVDFLSYAKTYRLFFGLKQTSGLLALAGKNSMEHGDYPQAQRFYLERLKLAREIGTATTLQHASQDLAECLFKQNKPVESLVYYRQAITYLSKKPACDLFKKCELLANTACLEEQSGNKDIAEKLRAQIIDSPPHCWTDTTGKEHNDKYISFKTFFDLVQCCASQKQSPVTAQGRPISATTLKTFAKLNDQRYDGLVSLKKNEYDKLLELSNHRITKCTKQS